MARRKGSNIIIDRIDSFLSDNRATKNEIFYHLNTFKDGTTPNQLNNLLRKRYTDKKGVSKKFIETDKGWEVKESVTLEA